VNRNTQDVGKMVVARNRDVQSSVEQNESVEGPNPLELIIIKIQVQKALSNGTGM
jgi:hypothetical protein